MDILRSVEKATPEQQAEVSLLMASGAIPSGVVLEILERFRPHDPLLSYWERRYPGKGGTLMRILHRCYSWDGTLQSFHPDVQDVLVKALFWVKALPSPKLIQVNGSKNGARHLIKTPLHVHLREYFADIDPLEASPWEPIDAIQDSRCVSQTYFRQYKGQLPSSIRALMWQGYDAVVRYICAYIVLNEDGRYSDRIADLVRLIAVFHTGRVLVGFTAVHPETKTARPVIVTASSSPECDDRDSVTAMAIRGSED